MGRLFLVDTTAAERVTLEWTVGGGSPVVIAAADVPRVMAEADVDAVVVGTAGPSPIATVQRVHRAAPSAGVVLLTSPATDAEVRRGVQFAPDMPGELAVVAMPDPTLPQLVADVLENARTRRRHQELMRSLSARPLPRSPHPLVPASLGALLDHAPFGVLVGATDGRLLSWNRWVGDLLELPADAVGKRIPDLFEDPAPLAAAFELAAGERLPDTPVAHTLTGPNRTAVDVTAVPSQLDDGTDAVLVLVQDVTARHRAEQTRDRLASHVGLLARVSEALTGTLDGDRALRQLSRHVVPTLADWVTLQAYDMRGNPRRVAVHHRDAELTRLARTAEERVPVALSPRSPSRRIAAGEGPVLMPRISDEELLEAVPDPHLREVLDRLGTSSVLSVPIPGRDGVLGAMTLVNGPGSDPFTEQDLAVAVEVGRRAGIALETIALYAQQRDLAAELQRSLLTEPPRSEHGEIVVRYVAAAHEAQVGGDWYDAFVQADNATVLVIGDVVGHDTRAAAAMGQLRALLRGIGYTTGTGPAEMLSRLDAAIEGLRVHTTATAAVARIEPGRAGDGTTTLHWSNAGHPPPVVLRPDGRAVVLEGEDADLLLGVVADTAREDRAARLEPGATLLLYTDGLVERRGRSFDEGIAELAAALESLADLPLAELCDRVIDRLVPDEREDDVALLALRIRA